MMRERTLYRCSLTIVHQELTECGLLASVTPTSGCGTAIYRRSQPAAGRPSAPFLDASLDGWPLSLQAARRPTIRPRRRGAPSTQPRGKVAQRLSRRDCGASDDKAFGSATGRHHSLDRATRPAVCGRPPILLQQWGGSAKHSGPRCSVDRGHFFDTLQLQFASGD